MEKKKSGDRHNADWRLKAIRLMAKGVHAGAGGARSWLGDAVDYRQDVHGERSGLGVHGRPFRRKAEIVRPVVGGNSVLQG